VRFACRVCFRFRSSREGGTHIQPSAVSRPSCFVKVRDGHREADVEALAIHFARDRVPTTALLARGLWSGRWWLGEQLDAPGSPPRLRNQETA
jgi:hypothetical protein